MLKKMLEIAMVALIVASVAGVFIKWMGSLPISVTQTQKNNTFDVTGEATVVVVPDQAMIDLGVQETGANLKQLQENINLKMSKISKELKNLGIEEKDIKTTGYNYYPNYENKAEFVGSASIQVMIRNMDQVSPALDLVGRIGLSNVNGPSFGLSDELRDKVTKQAREEAITKAKKKAEELAGLAGMKLGRIINIVEGNSPVVMPYMAREAMATAEDLKTATPVEVGSSEIRVSVALSYETL